MSIFYRCRWLLLVGLTLSIFGYAWMLGWLGSGSRGEKHTSQLKLTVSYSIDIPDLLVKFICGAVPIIFALPFFFVAGASLYSKLLPMQVQGKNITCYQLSRVKYNTQQGSTCMPY